jgi:hypothetical protein
MSADNFRILPLKKGDASRTLRAGAQTFRIHAGTSRTHALIFRDPAATSRDHAESPGDPADNLRVAAANIRGRAERSDAGATDPGRNPPTTGSGAETISTLAGTVGETSQRL